MKIVYLHYIARIDCVSIGPAVHIREFTEAMERRGHEVAVFPRIVHGSGTSTPGRIRWISRYVKQFKMILQNIPYFVREYHFVQSQKPDVLITRYSLYIFSSILVARLKRLPILLEINAPVAYERRTHHREFHSIPFLPVLFENAIVKHADASIVVSQALNDYLVKQGIRAGKIHVVPNGVDLEKFSRRDGREGVPMIEGIGRDDIVLGFIGSFNRWHGLDTLLNSLEHVLNEHGNVRLLLVGDGFARPGFEAGIRERGLEDRVVFTGMVPHREVPALLSAMDIVLAPYPNLEFFYFSPLKIFEYMAAGKPVVATRIGQIEQIIQDGWDGFLYDSGDDAAFQRIVDRLIGDASLRASVGEGARQSASKQFTWDRCAERVETVLHRLVRGDHGGSLDEP